VSSKITVELFGVPRLRAGVSRLALTAPTLADALAGLGEACPALAGTVLRDGHMHPAYRLCLNGERFVSDLATTLSDGDVLLLLAADVGG
jgi:molybdopterin converting factor small subunit